MKNRIYVYFLVSLFMSGCKGATDSSENEETVTDSTLTQTRPEKVINDAVTDENAATFAVINEDNPNVKDYQEFYENGQLKIEGDYDQNGDRHGLWYSYYETGIKWSESYYVNGIKSGHSVTFFPNGKIRYVGEYQNDKQHGLWRFYDEEGNLVNEENYTSDI